MGATWQWWGASGCVKMVLVGDESRWRSPTIADMPQIAALASRCDAMDGALEATLVDRLADRLGWDSDIGDVSRVVVAGNRIVAAGWASATVTISGYRDLLYAFADPARHQLTGEVMRWPVEHSPACAVSGSVQRIERVLAPASPDLPDAPLRLYASLGFTRIYVEHEMASALDGPSHAATPAGVTIKKWTRDLHPNVRDAYNDAFRDRGFAGYAPEEWDRVFRPEDITAEQSFVALRDDRVVGFVFSTVLDDPDDWIDPAIRGSGWIDTLGVVRAARGRGVATALLASAIDEMRRARASRVVLRINQDNKRAMRVYRRLGFELVRRHVVYARRV